MQRFDNVPLVDIQPEPIFPSRFGGDDRNLRGSIQNFGILNPACLRRSSNGLAIIDGLQRVIIARDIGLETIPCFVYDETDLDIDNAFLLCLELNRWQRHYNLVEKAQLLKAAHHLFGGQGIPKTFWGLVDIPHNIRAIQQYKDLLKLPPLVQKYAINNGIALVTILGFLHFPAGEIERIATRLFLLPLNQNRLNEILALLYDITKREESSPLTVLEDTLKAVETEFNAQQKEQKLRHLLTLRRNPNYEKKLAEFQDKVKHLPLPKDTRVEPAPFFEDDYIEVNTRVHNQEELNEFLESLKDGEWAKLFK
jgi:hypothetical protein